MDEHEWDDRRAQYRNIQAAFLAQGRAPPVVSVARQGRLRVAVSHLPRLAKPETNQGETCLKMKMAYNPRASMPGKPTNAGYAQTTLASGKGEGFCSTRIPWSIKKSCRHPDSESNPGFLVMKVTPYHWAPTMYSMIDVVDDLND